MPSLTGTPRNPLFGRKGEQAALEALLADVATGRGRAVMVLGEAGVGKTRLVEALVETAGRAGFATAWGRCPDGEVPSYWPWSQALRTLLDAAATAAVGPVGGGEATTSPLELGGDPTGGRARLFAAVVDALGDAARDRPLAVVLEDVHWADAPSLALLQFVVAALPGLGLLLVVTARDDPLECAPGVSAALAGLPPAVVRLPLRGLDEAATAALVEHIAGAAAGPSLVDRIHARTGGNPFFVAEVARLHVLRGRPETDVPPGVRQVLSRRAARLTQPACELLGAAAVIGEPDVHVLRAVTGAPLDRILTLLDEAVGARFVEPSRDGAAFRFVHALVREALYEDLGGAVRARLHRLTAEALETGGASAGARAASAGDIAMHWARAGPEPETAHRAAVLALRAADEAMASTGYEQAVRFYRWALDGGAGDAVAVTRALGEAQVLAGELTAGRETLHRAADLARAAGRADELARAVLAMGAGVGGFEVDLSDTSQRALLAEALDTLRPEDPGLRGAVMARLSLARAGQSTPDERAAMAEAAVDLGRRTGDPALEAAALAALCDARAGPDDVEERLAASERIVALASAAGDPRLLLLGRRLRLVAQLERGDLAAVDAEIAAYAHTAARLRLPLYAWLVPIWRGMRALLDGDVDGAWQASDEAEELGRRADSANAQMMVFSLRTAAARRRGTAAEIVAVMKELFLHSLDRYPQWRATFAAVLADAGQHDEARRHLRTLMATGMETIPKDSEYLELVWFLADAAMALDEPEAARAAHDALRPYAHLWAVDGIGGACFGPVSAQLERLARYLADHQAATPPPDRAPEPEGPGEEGEFRREGKVWQLRFRGQSAVVADSKGMADLAALLARPGREVSVLDLVDAAAPPSGTRPPRPATTAGPALDTRARAAYRARLAELEDDIAGAAANADRGRLERLQEERDFLAAELAAAVGLGGRPRLTGDPVERARKAVTMRIATALRAIDAAHPGLGRHLRLAVSTGRFCAYRPERPARWTT